MINDQSGEVVDEKQLAALNAYVSYPIRRTPTDTVRQCPPTKPG
jgi:hypothetical protein